MNSTDGYNTFVTSVEGNFDDCQRMVKEIFNDKEYNNELLICNYIFMLLLTIVYIFAK